MRPEDSKGLAAELRRRGVVKIFVQLLSSEDTQILKPVSLALGNLMCDNVAVCEELRVMGGIAHLLAALPLCEGKQASGGEGKAQARGRSGEDVPLLENLVNALANCVDGNAAAAAEVVAQDGVGLLLEVMETHGARAVPPTEEGQDSAAAGWAALSAAIVDSASLVVMNCAEAGGSGGCGSVHRGGGVGVCLELLCAPSEEAQANAALTLAYCAESGLVRRSSAQSRPSSARSTGSTGSGSGSSGSGSARSALSAMVVAEPGSDAARVGEEVRGRLRRAGGGLTSLTWMLDHSSSEVQRSARRCLRALRCGVDGGDAVLPFIEQGVVPLLHSLTASEDRFCARSAAALLLWLREGVRGAALAVLLRTLRLEGNEALRGHVATALVHLCFGAAHIRAAFVREGGLDGVLSMLRTRTGRSHALQFLWSVEPLLQAEAEADARERAEAEGGSGGGGEEGGSESESESGDPLAGDESGESGGFVLDDKASCDIVFLLGASATGSRAQSRSVRAHRAVLSRGSSALRDSLAHSLETREFVLESESPAVFRDTLSRVYQMHGGPGGRRQRQPRQRQRGGGGGGGGGGASVQSWVELEREVAVLQCAARHGFRRVQRACVKTLAVHVAQQMIAAAEAAGAVDGSGEDAAAASPALTEACRRILCVFGGAVAASDRQLASTCFSFCLENLEVIATDRAVAAMLPAAAAGSGGSVDARRRARQRRSRDSRSGDDGDDSSNAATERVIALVRQFLTQLLEGLTAAYHHTDDDLSSSAAAGGGESDSRRSSAAAIITG